MAKTKPRDYGPGLDGDGKGKPGPKPLHTYTVEEADRLLHGLHKRLEKLQLIVNGMRTHKITAKLANKGVADELMDGLREICENGRGELNKSVPAGLRLWDELDY